MEEGDKIPERESRLEVEDSFGGRAKSDIREFGWVALILGDLFFVVGWFGGGNDMTSTDTGIYNAYSKLV